MTEAEKKRVEELCDELQDLEALYTASCLGEA